MKTTSSAGRIEGRTIVGIALMLLAIALFSCLNGFVFGADSNGFRFTEYFIYSYSTSPALRYLFDSKWRHFALALVFGVLFR